MRTRVFGAAVAVLLSTGTGLAAPAAPKGPHPRMFLTGKTLDAVKAQSGNASSAVGRAIALCKKVETDAASFRKSGYQGDAWAFPLSACALAYQATGTTAYATTGIKLWKALLSDLNEMGDKGACVPSATDAQAIAAIRRDSGYAIRFIGPHTALAYDWLHDAPGVDDALRSQSRACFKAWVDWYQKSGYNHDQSGSNYHAGYVAAKTFIAVAESGEDGATSDRIWTETVDDIFGKQLIADGLGPTGSLAGGDWAEGWQYGPLSVLHYSLAARAIEEQGAAVPPLHQWASDLTLSFLYGLVPSRDGSWVGGDTSDEGPYLAPNGRVLAATLGGIGGDQAAGYAAFLDANVAKDKDLAPVFDALAEARGVAPVDPFAAKLSLFYVAKATRNVYMRSSWGTDAYWAVFSSAPHVVPDHQHVDATNFVFSRGGDHLVVDPSPYGSRSTLTGNALSVDSNISNPDYRPSQTPFSEADLVFARGTAGGVLAARGDFARAFDFADKPSDVPFARRDWVFTPEGEVILLDRTRTDAADRKTYLRIRTQAKLTLAGQLATGKVGGSQLAIHQVKTSGGTAEVKSYPAVDNCESGPFGACTNARFAVDEYSLTVPGPQALAVHVLDGLGASETPADVRSMSEAPIDASGQNAGVVGAAVFRNKTMTYVVASSAKDGAAGATLTYGTPGESGARHVVFDAPEDASGSSAVAVTANGGRCVVSITAGAGFKGRPLMFTVSSAADGCKATDDPDAPPAAVPPGDPIGPGGGGGGSSSDDATSDGGCGCTTPRHSETPVLALLAALALVALRAPLASRKR